MEGEAVMVKLALLDANDFVQSVLLDDEPYKLHFAWNDTSKAWTLDLRDSHGKDIVRGIRTTGLFERQGKPRLHFGGGEGCHSGSGNIALIFPTSGFLSRIP